MKESIPQAENKKSPDLEEFKKHLGEFESSLENSSFTENLEGYEKVSSERANQATSIAVEIDTLQKNPAQEETGVEQEIEKIDTFFESDRVLKKVEESIAESQQENELSPEQKEKLKQTVKQSTIRNGAFFVHTINEREELRHNSLSNVSKETTFEDDIDILISLEPSISASTIVPGADENGMVSGLWSHTGGIIIADGQIKEAHYADEGTSPEGIKNRNSVSSEELSTEEIDTYAKNRRTKLQEDPLSDGKKADIGGYNEYVIDNPKIFGYYLHAEQDSEGNFWAYDLGLKKQKDSESSEERDLHRSNVARYESKIKSIQEKGLPLYIMTPDRKIYEYKETKDGQVMTGNELHPEDIEENSFEKSTEEKKEIGRKLLEKEIFEDEATKKEALEILFTPEEIEKREETKKVIEEILRARFENIGFVQEILKSPKPITEEVFDKYQIKEEASKKILNNTSLREKFNSSWGEEGERNKYIEIVTSHLEEK